MRLLPPKASYVLVYFLAFWLNVGICSIVASYFIGENGTLSKQQFYACLFVGGFLAFPGTIWFMKSQWIELTEDRAIFKFTHYLIPHAQHVLYSEIQSMVFYDGIFGNDNRPRPYIYIERQNGSTFWVPLPIYSRQDLNRMLEFFQAKALKVDIKGRVKFVSKGKKYK